MPPQVVPVGSVQFFGMSTVVVRDSPTAPNSPWGPNGPRAMLRSDTAEVIDDGRAYVPENWNEFSFTNSPWPIFCQTPLLKRTSTSTS